MIDKVEKRKAFLINTLYLIAVLALIYFFLKYCFSFAAPFLFAFFIAVFLQRPLNFLDKKTNKKCHGLFSILLVLMCVLILFGPVIVAIAMGVKEIAGFISYLIKQLNDIPAFLATLENEILKLIDFLPDNLYTNVSDTIASAFDKLISNVNGTATSSEAIGIDFKAITSGVTSGISGIYSVLKNVPSILINIIIGIIATIFFTKDYDYVVKFIKLQLPEGKKNILSEIKQVFSRTVLKMVKAYGLIMFITFCELALGLTILNLSGLMNNPYIYIIAALIAIFDILPVAGSGGILIPWALIRIVLGNYAQAIGLLIIYAVISIIRQYIEPRIVGSSLGVHPLVTLSGLYFGIKLFGVMGMFIVPMCLMIIKAFNDTGRIHLYVPPQMIDENEDPLPHPLKASQEKIKQARKKK